MQLVGSYLGGNKILKRRARASMQVDKGHEQGRGQMGAERQAGAGRGRQGLLEGAGRG